MEINILEVGSLAVNVSPVSVNKLLILSILYTNNH